MLLLLRVPALVLQVKAISDSAVSVIVQMLRKLAIVFQNSNSKFKKEAALNDLIRGVILFSFRMAMN